MSQDLPRVYTSIWIKIPFFNHLSYLFSKTNISRWWVLLWCRMQMACHFFISLFFPARPSLAMFLYCWELTLEPNIVYHQAMSQPAIVNPCLPIFLFLQTWLQVWFFFLYNIDQRPFSKYKEKLISWCQQEILRNLKCLDLCYEVS